jgi:hypothetical protein
MNSTAEAAQRDEESRKLVLHHLLRRAGIQTSSMQARITPLTLTDDALRTQSRGRSNGAT